MKIKLDENMPAELVHALESLGHDVETVPQELLAGVADPLVRKAARLESRFLVTQDKKFIDKRTWESDPGSGAMLVRIDNETRQLIFNTVLDAFTREPVESWIGCIVVVTASKVRVRLFKGKEA